MKNKTKWLISVLLRPQVSQFSQEKDTDCYAGCVHQCFRSSLRATTQLLKLLKPLCTEKVVYFPYKLGGFVSHNRLHDNEKYPSDFFLYGPSYDCDEDCTLISGGRVFSEVGAGYEPENQSHATGIGTN